MILINLVPVKSGGGLQNALSFIDQLPYSSTLADNSVVVCRNNSEIHLACKRNGIRYILIHPSLIGRLWFELFYGQILILAFQVKVVFTLFGNPPIISFCSRKISGFAFSNILCPEVPFWDFAPPLRRLLFHLKDKIRLLGALLSDEIILETEYLALRALRGVFSQKVIHVVEMEPSSLILPKSSESRPAPKSSCGREQATFNILYLCGPHPNKRVHLLAPIIAELDNILRSCNISPILECSFSPDSKYAAFVARCFDDHSVSGSLRFLGPIPCDNLHIAIGRSSCLINIARLESFSNNWVEAWSFGVPLVSTRADWARESCGEAALYIDPIAPSLAAQVIARLAVDIGLQDRLRCAGFNKIKKLASRKKIHEYEQIIFSSNKIS